MQLLQQREQQEREQCVQRERVWEQQRITLQAKHKEDLQKYETQAEKASLSITKVQQELEQTAVASAQERRQAPSSPNEDLSY